MITSVQNPKIKWVRSIQTQNQIRRQEQIFVVEGVRLVEEAMASNFQAQLVLYTEDLGVRGQVILEKFLNRGVQIEQVASQVMRAASDTQNPQGILVALNRRDLPLPEKPDFIFVPDMVRDPGNLGAMLRTAAAAGAQIVLVPPETVDPFAPKVVRSAMGAHFRLAIHTSSWEDIARQLQSLHAYLATAGEGDIYTDADFRLPLALFVGSEAEGASLQARNLANTCVQIPMPGGGESLNAAVAAGVLMFEVVRQRSTQDGQ